MSCLKCIDIPPKLEKVREVCEEMTQTVLEASGDADLTFRVNIGLTEALTNSIVHGCRNCKTEVEIGYSVKDELHVFSITDPGQGPCDESIKFPKLDEDLLSEHHRGNVIIKWAADEISFQRLEKGFTLTLGFRSRPLEERKIL